MKRAASIPTTYSWLLLLVSFGLAVIVAEVVLLLFVSDDSVQDKYYVWPPDLQKVFRPIPEVMPGISGESRFIINESGIRGDSFSKEDGYRILTLGGSTTECLYLDQSEAWPALLQRSLNKRLGRSDIWVGNIGKSGHNTNQHRLQLEKLLEQYPRIDLVVLLIGMNDMSRRLIEDADYRPINWEQPEQRHAQLDKAFSVYPDLEPGRPFYTRTAIWRTYRKAKRAFLKSGFWRNRKLVQDEAGSVLIEWRENRRNAAKVRETMPDLSLALEEYRHNINKLIDSVQEKGVRIIFMSQPSMWRRDLPESLGNLLWSGGVGDFQQDSGEYYSLGVLADAIDIYNKSLLQACTQRAIECIDLASNLPKDTTVFYDDVHLNENGARKAANILADYLIESGMPRPASTIAKP
jgi:lysophospholipase L1-like esterase